MNGEGGLSPRPQPVVVARGLNKHYGSEHVLKDVDLDVYPGEVCCLMGPSGAGKSTLLHCLNWLVPPDSGQVWINGSMLGYRMRDGRLRELRERELARSRAHIGMVFQSFNLFAHRTVLENVVEGPVQVLGLRRADAQDRALRLLEQVQLAHRAGSYPSQLSGGQQQRIAIARALAMEPAVMLFDEPTSALDPELVGEVLDVMQDLAKGGMTMVVVTHEIGFARQVGTTLAFMDQGRVVEVGEPSQMISDPTSQRAREFMKSVLS